MKTSDLSNLFTEMDRLNLLLQETFETDSVGVCVENYSYDPKKFRVYLSNADLFELRHHEQFKTFEEAVGYVERICEENGKKGKKKRSLEKLIGERSEIDKKILELAISE